MSLRQQRSGFSLVELVIIMAIFGLILILVFAAFKRADTGRKDSAIEADAARYLNATQQWISDNNGSLPGPANFNDPANGIKAKYITAGGVSFKTPSGIDWVPTWASSSPSPPQAQPQMLVYTPAFCDATSQVLLIGGNNRQIAVAVQLTGGQYYCISK